MTWFERLSLIASFGSLVVSVVAFGPLAWQLRMLSRNTRQDHATRRKQATMDYLTANMDRRNALFSEGIPLERDSSAVSVLISRSLSGHEPTTKLITAYLTTFNFLAVGAQRDAFDLGVIDEAWGGLIIRVWENYRPWIEAQRNEHGEPRVWENLEWLAGHMTPRRLVAPAQGSGSLPPQGQPVP